MVMLRLIRGEISLKKMTTSGEIDYNNVWESIIDPHSKSKSVTL